MNSTRLIIVFFLLVAIPLFSGCGRKTPPVYSEKEVVSIAEEAKK